MENIIEINNLTFKYDNKNALFEGLSVSIEKGKITTLLGKNGCGKSTLIKILAKNLNYNSGSVKIEGKELNSYSLKELASILAVVYQKNETPREITVYDMVSFARLPYQNIFFYKPTSSDVEKLNSHLKKLVYSRIKINVWMSYQVVNFNEFTSQWH